MNKEALSRKYLIIFPAILLTLHQCFCQEVATLSQIAEVAEELAGNDNDPGAAELYFEYLNELSENPVKINSHDDRELSRLFFLSEFQIKSLSVHVIQTGNILSSAEIATIAGFDSHLAEMMEPFISLTEEAEQLPGSINVKYTLLTNVIVSPGEKDTSDLASPLKILTRFRVTASQFSAGITAEKDRGEKYLSGKPPLPDFLSAYLAYSGRKVIRKLILGDYSLRIGAGSCFNTGLRTGIQVTAGSFMPAGNNLRPCTSSDENNFFRGVAADLQFRKLETIIFWSRNRIDAIPLYSADSSVFAVSGLYSSGLHNTSAYLNRKDIQCEEVFGMSITYNMNYVKIGASWARTHFSLPLIKDESDPLNLFDFEGQVNDLCSAYYSAMAGRVLLFGDISLSSYRRFSFVQGASLRPSDRLTVNVLARSYSPGFVAFNGKAPGNGSSSANERGITGNFTFEAASYLFIVAGIDVSDSPWLKYRAGFPSLSRREAILARYIPREKLALEIGYDCRMSMLDEQVTTGIPGVKTITDRAFRMQFRYLAVKQLAFTAKAVYKIVSPGNSRGSLLMGDISYRFASLPLVLWYRYCLYSGTGWDSRIYSYENDLLYSFSVPALYGDGSRSYLMAKLDIGRHGEIRIKYGITEMIDKPGAYKYNDELKLQLRFWF
jgi:hypothetical protein